MQKLLSLLLTVVFCTSMYAKNIVVTTTENVGEEPGATPGSLSYSLAQAEDGDVIVFDASLSGQTILFDARVSIEMNLDIDASALEAPIIFDGQVKTSFLVLGSYAERHTNDQTNRLKNIVFQNGYCNVAGEPGAVNIFAKKTYFNNCTFLNNKSMEAGTNRQPGAIRNSNSHSFMYITDCVFRGNETARKGGAISVDAPTVYINRCLFDSNKAGDSGAAIDTKDGTVGGENVSPVLDIRNSTFVNNTCDYTKKNDGMVIFNGQSSSPYPVKLLNCTFVGNKNLKQSDVSTVYVTKSAIQIAGCLFGGNKFLKNEMMNYANDVRVGSDANITSFGYNYVYSMRAADSQTESPMQPTDVEYKTWTATPLVKEEANAKGVCEPTDEVMESDLWKDLKVIPGTLIYEMLGDNATDQTGTLRSEKLSSIGAYEIPAYVLTIEDEYFGVTPEVGTHVYKVGESVTVSTNNTNLVSWIVNGTHNTDKSLVLVMDKDYDVAANYESGSGIDTAEAMNNIYFIDGQLYINELAGARLQVYTVMGQLVLSQEVSSDEEIVTINKPTGSIYVVSIVDKSGKRAVGKIQ